MKYSEQCAAISGHVKGGVSHLLNQFDSELIPYVSWKNNHELFDALTGNTDLDIFIPLQFRAAVLGCAARLDWIKFDNPVACFPWVTHLYKLDEDLQQCHLHVYFKVVTGESWLKEFVLPFDTFLISERVRAEGCSVWVLNNRAQAYLFVVRHLLKGGSLSSRALYRREFESYRQEWFQCHQEIEALNDWGPVRLNDYIVGGGLQTNEFQLPRVLAAIKFRASLAPFLRLLWCSLPLRRINSLVVRLMNKLVFRRKKIFPECGLIIAITGVDGAGKSTMLNEADSLFSRFITIQRFALGRPQGRILEAVRRLIKRDKILDVLPSQIQRVDSFTALPSVLSSVSAAVLALLRLRMARKAAKCALKGHLALVDRWPTGAIGMMDGPRLIFNKNSSSLLRLSARIERWAYQRMPRADICFFLDAPVQTLVDRNRSRIKVEKETDEEIGTRFKHNQDFEPLARKVVHFDNNGPLEQKRKELLLCIWKEMAGS